MRFAGWLNSEWLRTVSYIAAIVTCACAGRHELKPGAPDRSELWPRFWFAVAGVLTALLIGRLTGVGATALEFGRNEAITGGWYWSARRRLQGGAIVVVGTVGLASILLLARVMRGRTRQYVAPLVCVVALAGFAATRIVSLHQVDTLLYRRLIFGARIASLIELTLTAVLVGLAVDANRSSDRSARTTRESPRQDSPRLGKVGLGSEEFTENIRN